MYSCVLTFVLLLLATRVDADELASQPALELNGANTLPLSQRFPAYGDAAGGDLAAFPRPRASRRVLSARLRGYGVVAYEVAQAPAEALAAYTRELLDAGFRVVSLGSSALALRADESAVVHSFQQGAHGVLALVRMNKEQTRAK
jgi:hypothetical protein